MTLAPQSLTVARPLRPLEDLSGRRLRWMRRVGRAIALLFLLWFVALVLGALGVAPNGGWHLARALGPQSAPASLARRASAPRPPAIADFARVLPQAAASVPFVRRPSAPAKTRTHGRSAVAPGHTKTTPATATPGQGHAYGRTFAKKH